jgi:hypothetical protein
MKVEVFEDHANGLKKGVHIFSRRIALGLINGGYAKEVKAKKAPAKKKATKKD